MSLVSTAKRETGAPMTAPQRVLVGVDGSECSRRALTWAAAEAERSHAILEVVTASTPGYEFIPATEAHQGMREIVDGAAALVARLTPTVKVIATIHEGAPAKYLIDESANADLLVVGARGLGGFLGLLRGSISHQCSSHAACPVVVVP